MLALSILLQVTPHLHPIWGNAFFYLFIASILGFFIITLIIMKTLRKKTADAKLMQQQHVARVDLIRKDHSDTLEKIRVEMLKREEERTRQWMESEKETLHVLNGVSTLLDLSETIGRVESEKILKVLDNIYGQVEKLTVSGYNLDVLAIIKEKVKILAVLKEKIEKLDVISEKIGTIDIIKEKLGTIDIIKEKLETIDIIKEKLETIDIIKEKVEVLDVIKEKMATIDVIKEKIEKFIPKD